MYREKGFFPSSKFKKNKIQLIKINKKRMTLDTGQNKIIKKKKSEQ